jgi:molecular chaperone GrpE (heat shock protein)
MNPEGNGEISNEFFKKLNQQIVQKDNLIKLLQLQIRNLKTQIESGGAGSEEAAELKKALEDKSSEAERLLAELNLQKERMEAIEQQKDEQIRSLSQMLEQHQGSSDGGSEMIEDPRVQELENVVAALQEELEFEKQAKAQLEQQAVSGSGEDVSILQQEVEQLRAELMSAAGDKQEIQNLQISLEASRVELEQANLSLESMSAQLQGASSGNDDEAAVLKSRILELEQDCATLKNLLAEKEEAGGNAVEDAGLVNLQFEVEQLRSRLAEYEANPVVPTALQDELDSLRQQASQSAELAARVAAMQKESENFAETAMKLTALEVEREQLSAELDRLRNTAADSGEVDACKLEIARLREANHAKDEELARLRVSLEARQDESMNDPAIREEVEQLTQQVADQLLAIQNFEGILSRTREQLGARDSEIASLKAMLGSSTRSAEPAAVIPVDGENEIISSFIDFFDGLDSIISKNPIPELQILHQKLLDRLIVPNQISYMPVISAEFNPEKHAATDYFRSDRFPDKCIVFEVEKGYCKGDTVIKKSKVWVVQNLFNCQACGAMQSNPDSRFCHMCGAKIVAPNGLPIDNLPEFDPTPATYQRFADSMMARGQTEQAKVYLQAGLELDPGFVPLMTRLADILASESRFDEALELLNRANASKQDKKIAEKIQALEVKLSIFRQAQALKLAPEEFDKLLHLIQK